MSLPSGSNGRRLVAVLAAALFVLHQDFWWWDNRTLVFGFLPIGLFYHAMFSLSAGLLWALANKVAWPEHIEEWAAEGESETVTGGRSQ
jgi:hypothetical protein